MTTPGLSQVENQRLPRPSARPPERPRRPPRSGAHRAPSRRGSRKADACPPPFRKHLGSRVSGNRSLPGVDRRSSEAADAPIAARLTRYENGTTSRSPNLAAPREEFRLSPRRNHATQLRSSRARKLDGASVPLADTTATKKVMIVALHVATGATVGAAVRSRTAAALLGVPLHLAGDRVPHRDIHNRRFEVCSGLVLVGLLALRRGLTDASTIGALAACSPDVEHIMRLPRPGGSKLFHGRRGWHRSGGLSTRTQLLVAGLLVGSCSDIGRREPSRVRPTPRARSASRGDVTPCEVRCVGRCR